MTDDALYKAFLGELEALEKFRITYSGMYPQVPLNREDPDVRRMIEALAMFTARTRRAGERALSASMLRLFRQHFPFLLSPMPMMALLYAGVGPRFVDTAFVPRGTQVIVAPDPTIGSGPGLPEKLSFRTLTPLRVLPITLDRVGLFATEVEARGAAREKSQGAYRMVLDFSAAHERLDVIEQLDLYINHLNDFASSLTVHHALARHITRAAIVFDQDVREDTAGSSCQIRFGQDEAAIADTDLFAHPLERVRSLLHFPQQDLLLSVRVTSQPRSWRRFSLVFELSEQWPRELKLTADTFQLHVAPMVNLTRAMADPIAYDATRDRYAILHPDVSLKYRMHSVLGVYRLDQDDGLVPLRPGIVGEREQAYEVETEGARDTRRAFITLDLPSAFGDPFRVAVDALWHQPVLEDDGYFDYKVGLFDRYFEGLTWNCLGAISQPRESALINDVDGLLELLSLKNKRFLDREEIVFLFDSLGTKGARTFSEVLRALSDVQVEQKPYARGTSGFKYIYTFTFGRLDGAELPLLDLFMRHARSALRAWSVDEVVELTVKVPGLEHTATYA